MWEGSEECAIPQGCALGSFWLQFITTILSVKVLSECLFPNQSRGSEANSQYYMDDEPANTGEGGVPIDNRSNQKMKQGWANNKKEKGNPK